MDVCEFKTSQLCLVSSKLETTYCDPALNKQTNKQLPQTQKFYYAGEA